MAPLPFPSKFIDYPLTLDPALCYSAPPVAHLSPLVCFSPFLHRVPCLCSQYDSALNPLPEGSFFRGKNVNIPWSPEFCSLSAVAQPRSFCGILNFQMMRSRHFWIVRTFVSLSQQDLFFSKSSSFLWSPRTGS